ncbi:hypothetical protein IQ269_15075 [Tychonema sp. LEGE 07199]|uniref:hypothetical protein n=1 Tax=unclassified Tychonema TaxID=2642144 RepID=UPI001881F701|nr:MULTISPECIES: hypothetical protein [unclassified Tychonema]MBE9122094.1 hypothetical protein [Tychonema sp. LEGE 07199]MBE9134287.1 hypothetical protein [Tychonema sp. LEGE 07196]
MQPLQIPAFRLTLYCKRLTLYCKRLTLGHTKNQLIFLVAASIDGASGEQISLLAGDQVTASSRSPGSFRVSTKKSKNGATIGTPLEPGNSVAPTTARTSAVGCGLS